MQCLIDKVDYDVRPIRLLYLLHRESVAKAWTIAERGVSQTERFRHSERLHHQRIRCTAYFRQRISDGGPRRLYAGERSYGMIAYHSSYCVVEQPDVCHSRECLDFGRGFYVTYSREQTIKYAKRFLLRRKKAFLNIYELTETADVRASQQPALLM